MGFRFRRSIRLGKGLRINLSKSGTSLSVGRRGATVNFGPKGEKMTVGLPGTGLSYSKMITKPPASEGRFVDPTNEIDQSPPSQNQSGRMSAILPWLVGLAVLLVIVAVLIAQSS